MTATRQPRPPLATLRRRLLLWYDRSGRDLPWRRTRDPYAIWVSEIMLQQTRVAAVLGRYPRFLQRFPNVHALARAPLNDVLSEWSGLGYYRRARSLHQAARSIVRSQGALPVTSEEWRELAGVGRYTAAAIASIAFGERCAVVDGNVERVLRRVAASPAMAGAEIWKLASDWISPERPGDFNQAMMELGATVCLPSTPRCGSCPLRAWCRTRGELPSKRAAARQRRQIACALALRNGSVYLKRRRASERIMPGMWELPEIEANGQAPEISLRHAITVTDFRVKVVRAKTAPPGGRWVAVAEAAALPLTGLARKILRRAGVI